MIEQIEQMMEQMMEQIEQIMDLSKPLKEVYEFSRDEFGRNITVLPVGVYIPILTAYDSRGAHVTRIMDVNGAPISSGFGTLTPHNLGCLPNFNPSCPYRIEVEHFQHETVMVTLYGFDLKPEYAHLKRTNAG